MISYSILYNYFVLRSAHRIKVSAWARIAYFFWVVFIPTCSVFFIAVDAFPSLRLLQLLPCPLSLSLPL